MDNSLKASIVIVYGILACFPAVAFFESHFQLSGPRVTGLLCYGFFFPFYFGYRMTNKGALLVIAVALVVLGGIIFSTRIDHID